MDGVGLRRAGATPTNSATGSGSGSTVEQGYGRGYRDDSVGAGGDSHRGGGEQRGLHHRKHHSTGHDSSSQQGHTKLGSSATAAKARMHGLLKEVEKEFEALCLENARLREKVVRMEKGEQAAGGRQDDDRDVKNLAEEPDQAFEAMLRSFTKKNALKTRRKLKQHTSKIVSSFRPPLLTASLVKEYRGHRDGIWDVAVSNLGHPLIGTASADKTARVWGIDSSRCLISYVGHGGSVNSISFHPSQDIALTASGDGTAHVWKANALPDNFAGITGAGVVGGGTGSSEESAADSSEDDARGVGGAGGAMAIGRDAASSNRINIIRQPIVSLTGHQNVVIGCQWLDDELAVTASWDRSANLYNVETGGTLLQTLAGHDDELTHVACHPTMRLVATSSVDTTFRLWDFRETIHSVSVFQGHTEAVTCAVFSRSDQIVSGSDDRSVKVWDLRNMRAPVTSIQAPSAVNRLAVSHSGFVAIPHDNRQVAIYDLNGQKILRLPRDSANNNAASSKKCHYRMVTSCCWAPGDYADGWRSRAGLFSAGFDRVAFGWCVRPAKEEAAATSYAAASNMATSRPRSDKAKDSTF